MEFDGSVSCARDDRLLWIQVDPRFDNRGADAIPDTSAPYEPS